MGELTGILGGYAAIFLAGLLGLSAAHKLVARERAVAAARALTRLGDAARFAVWAAVASEASLSIAVAWPATRPVGAFGAGALWAMYALLIRLNGGADDCGCTFGPSRTHRPGPAVLRNALLCSLAVAVASAPGRSAPIGMSVLAAAGLLTLYVAFDQVQGAASGAVRA